MIALSMLLLLWLAIQQALLTRKAGRSIVPIPGYNQEFHVISPVTSTTKILSLNGHIPAYVR